MMRSGFQRDQAGHFNFHGCRGQGRNFCSASRKLPRAAVAEVQLPPLRRRAAGELAITSAPGNADAARKYQTAPLVALAVASIHPRASGKVEKVFKPVAL